MKVIELFAGIGSQTQALKNLSIIHKSKISEIDKYAIKSYNAMHGEIENLGDISKIEKLPYADLITYSFPCQDISVAGKQAGIKCGTRSGLLLEVERIIENMIDRPKYLLLENVKNLVGKKHKEDFDRWLKKLEDLGYKNYWKILNTKDYGIPQNRERVFCLSIKKELDNGFEFPEKQELKLRLKDMLEIEVDEKYYLKPKQYENLIKNMPKWNTNPSGKGMNGNVNTKDIANTVTTNKGEGRKILEPRCIIEPVIAASRGRNPENPSDRTAGSPTEQRLEVNKQGLSNTITTVQKDNYVVEPKILKVGSINSSQDGIVHNTEGISQCLSAGHGNTPKIIEEFRIRKLTAKECWRLQGCSDEQFEKAEKVCSNSQLYKQAGNSITVNVLMAIFDKMIKYGYIKELKNDSYN